MASQGAPKTRPNGSLRSSIRAADAAYRAGQAYLSDVEFDGLVAELQQLDPSAPELLTPGGGSKLLSLCPASTPLADWRQSSWPVRGTDRPPVVAGDNWGAMTLEATRKLSHTSVRAIASTDFL
ncbi:hypothetical protein [Synechococcus sp. CBW1108]|uniref:hypothetical protein n=1 Tax=Synechococcus sp. CBW1108 TaxID=1353147 RepID=UPI0018CF0D23|nr:hypothetical protein [Synechococcus sp. CBW1108]QPN69949.1 hypothetical protein H8F27_16200 [Synechococcus sp. CBW1108]